MALGGFEIRWLYFSDNQCFGILVASASDFMPVQLEFHAYVIEIS